MKLSDVWNVCVASKDKPVSTWGTLASLKKPPRVAYRLLKYGVKLAAEFEVVEAYRTKLVYQCAGAADGQPVNIEPGTPEFNKFVQGFNEFLGGDADLAVVDLSMDALIDALDEEKGNVLSERDLSLLEPFFQPATPAA